MKVLTHTLVVPIYTVSMKPVSVPVQVNIDHHHSREIVDAMQAPSRDTFSKAQHSIFLLMARDSYVRFIKSDKFQSALQR